MPVIVDVQHSDRLWVLRLQDANDDLGYTKIHSIDGGNLETTPPIPAKGLPVGHAYVGDTQSENIKPFLTGWRAQVPRFPHPMEDSPIVLPTQWLATVGHVDELVSFVPRWPGGKGYVILFPSARLAVELLHRQIVESLGAGGKQAAWKQNVSVLAPDEDESTRHREIRELCVEKNGDRYMATCLIKSAGGSTFYTATDTEFYVRRGSFVREGDDLLCRIGDELVAVTATMPTAYGQRLTVTRAERGTDPTPHEAGTPIYALTEDMLHNWVGLKSETELNPDPHVRLREAVTTLATALGINPPKASHTERDLIWRPMPVFFKRNGTKWAAYTANVVNCLVAPKGAKCYVVMNDPECEPFKAWIREALVVPIPPGNLTFIDAWISHRQGGEVHCGTNALRKPHATTTWWDAWDR
jgi:hypothetical protein